VILIRDFAIVYILIFIQADMHCLALKSVITRRIAETTVRRCESSIETDVYGFFPNAIRYDNFSDF
jgi:hypothetical protein